MSIPTTLTDLTLVSAARLGLLGLDTEPEAPPGTEDISDLFRYGIWVGMIVLAGALAVGIVRFGASWQRNGEVEGVKQSLFSLVALVALGSFGQILGAFTSI